MSEKAKSLPADSRIPRVELGNGIGLLILYLVMVFVISRLSPFFLGSRNLVNLPVSVAVIGMIAIFSTMLMIGGGLDLSVGATTALVGVVTASTQGTFGVWGAAAFGVLIGLLIGVLQSVGGVLVGAEAAYGLVFVVMIVVLIFRPAGLLGKA